MLVGIPSPEKSCAPILLAYASVLYSGCQYQEIGWPFLFWSNLGSLMRNLVLCFSLASDKGLIIQKSIFLCGGLSDFFSGRPNLEIG
jgi:hypothetical protein